ncbi:MAG: DUF1972 domain-containing protein [Nevskiaceae bacterium]|nr:MAG: DUF1972 domain-containing protein [Nevskiaceae bacterium]
MRSIGFIGSVGLPNRYGGFETFVSNVAPLIAAQGHRVFVTCDASRYRDDDDPMYDGVERIFVPVKANGAFSILHDFLAFLFVFRKVDTVVVLGVSAGLFFPFMRLLCGRKRQLITNIDGVEWRRTKHSAVRRAILRLFDGLAQLCSHHVVFDNEGLRSYVLKSARNRASMIAYGGDHVGAGEADMALRQPGCGLTVCRIEPENNIEMLISGALASRIQKYRIVGNWSDSHYGRQLRESYRHEPRLELLDPIYESSLLHRLRSSCDMYLHGHSVGGTNPSLVEALFYPAQLICFDCSFNRHTAGNAAFYFSDDAELACTINDVMCSAGDTETRQPYREIYRWSRIAGSYLSLGEADGQATAK